MALFNILGSGDWGVTNAAQQLCENFSEGNNRKHKSKSKNKVNLKRIDKKLKGKILKSVSLCSNSELLNGKEKLMKQIKKTLKKQKSTADDKVPLNKSLVELAAEPNETSKKKKAITSKNLDLLGISPHSPEAETSGKSKRKKKKKASKRKEAELEEQLEVMDKTPTNSINPQVLKKRRKQLAKLQELLSQKDKQSDSVGSKSEHSNLTLRERMMRKLKAARFRFLNEQIYNTTGKETEKIFRRDPEAFKAYHQGYKLQLKRWPMNPLDKIIKSINKMAKTHVIADFGCGEARLAQSVEHKVHSFDLVAANDSVTPCDMAHVPLTDSSVDVAVFCLSLMGTNLKDYLLEANRVLKKGGILKIAEVESRFEDVDAFIKSCEQYGFRKTWMDLSYNLFYFIDFRKESNSKNKAKLPSLTLQPCLYKKR